MPLSICVHTCKVHSCTYNSQPCMHGRRGGTRGTKVAPVFSSDNARQDINKFVVDHGSHAALLPGCWPSGWGRQGVRVRGYPQAPRPPGATGTLFATPFPVRVYLCPVMALGCTSPAQVVRGCTLGWDSAGGSHLGGRGGGCESPPSVQGAAGATPRPPAQKQMRNSKQGL